MSEIPTTTIINKIDNLLLNGEKILEKLYKFGSDEKAYVIDRIHVRKEELNYFIYFNFKDSKPPFARAVYEYLKTKYEDDRKKAKEKTKLLEDFEFYINDLQ